jgi:hypothetical protein
MKRRWIPHILRPEYTWPRPMQADIMTETPTIPSVSGPRIRRLWGLVYRLLARLSDSYCSWFNIPFTPPIMDLPFGLILKWGERVRIEEAVAMQIARTAGMPVPKVLCCGESPNDSFRPISILMMRLPGWPLVILSDSFSADDEDSWLTPLGKCLNSMHSSLPPPSSFCSLYNTGALRSPGTVLKSSDYSAAPAAHSLFS